MLLIRTPDLEKFRPDGGELHQGTMKTEVFLFTGFIQFRLALNLLLKQMVPEVSNILTLTSGDRVSEGLSGFTQV